MITVIAADDDPIILAGLRLILSSAEDITLAATASNKSQALSLCEEHRPNVALLDIQMPGGGIEAAGELLERKLSLPILLTTFDEPELMARGIRAGVKGYILKHGGADNLLETIRAVAGGAVVFAPEVTAFIAGHLSVPKPEVFAELTKREQSVAELIAKGKSNADISRELFLSEGYVRNAVSAVLGKLGCEHRTQVAAMYYN